MKTKENMLRVIRRDNPQWVPDGMAEAVVTLKCPVVERPARAGLDAFGVRWDYEPGAEGGTYPAIGGNVIDDIESWREQLKVPDLDAVDWSSAAKQAESVDRDRFLVSGFVEMGIFERSYLLFGMEEALINYLIEPDEMKALAHVIADYKISLIEHYYEAAHMDMIWYGDDWGTQTNLFLPVQTWRDIIRPETQRIYDCMKRLGVMINQHSCGKIDSIVGDIVEMGADMLNPLQPCNDLARMKRLYGDKLCFIGGIDSQFVLSRPGVTPDEVEAEVKRRIRDMAQGGGYVAAPSHDVPYDPEILAAMRGAISTYGKYPLEL